MSDAVPSVSSATPSAVAAAPSDTDIVRKRSRSASASGLEADAAGANGTGATFKKAHLAASPPAVSASEDQKDAVKTTAEEGESSEGKVGEDSKMIIDMAAADLPANPSNDPAVALTTEEAAAAAAAADAAEAAASSITMRALIVTQDASIIIGKQGKHVNEIRDKSGSKITISETIVGSPERVLAITGPLDAVSKAFGLVVRRINDEPFDVPSVPGSRAVTIRSVLVSSIPLVVHVTYVAFVP